MADTTFQALDAASQTVSFLAQNPSGTSKVMMSVPSDTSGTAMIGQKVMASSLPVAIASNQSPVPVTAVLAGGTASVALAGGTSIATLAGGTAQLAGGTATVTLAGGTAALAGGTATVTNAGGTTALAGGTATVTLAGGTALISGTAIVNLAYVGGTAVSLGQKVMATSIPVAIASDQPSLPVTINTTQIGPLGQTVMASSVPVAIASNQSAVQIAIVGYTALPVGVANGAQAPWSGDKYGRGLFQGSIRGLRASQRVTTNTAAEVVIVNAINASTIADLYGLVLANTGNTSTQVDIRYGIGSAILMSFQVASSDTGGFMLPTADAIPGSLASANFSWTAQCAASTVIAITALYVRNGT